VLARVNNRMLTRSRVPRISSPANISICRRLSMGRAGIEPATLGLKVRPKKLRPSARSRNSLQIARVFVASELQRTVPCGDKRLRASLRPNRRLI
jgi:hypothetical protein